MLRVCSVHAMRGRRGDPPHELRVAAFVHAVLGPRARIVLDARNFDDRDATRGIEVAHAVAVGVAGEVAARSTRNA